MTQKNFTLKEETRKRCKVIALDEKTLRRFSPISMELFQYLYQVPKLEVSIYMRVDGEMVEFVRKEEYSVELLTQINDVMLRDFINVGVYVTKVDRDRFDQMIGQVRRKKIDALLEKNPDLDRKVLDVFNNLSSASQMIVRGGITTEVAQRVKSSASYMVQNLMDSEIAIGTLSKMVISDPTLYDHSASVAMLAGVIASKILRKPMSIRETEIAAQCGLYHDVGKTCVPNAVLNKPGKLTPEEFEVMKSHTVLGHQELLKCVADGAAIDANAVRVALEHHEKFHGKGYPYGKHGRFEENEAHGIHLYSRITSIADVYSALLMKRIYKPAYEAQDAIKIMAECANDYDPEIFKNFLMSVIKSLNAQQAGAGKGRILTIESGKLQETKKVG